MSTKRILIIDDEEPIREIVQACLEDLGGWEVVSAESAKEGLLKAQTAQPDAILLDVSMPEMDGVALFEQLQKIPAVQAIPVVLLTARVLHIDRTRFEPLGIAGLISKPFNPVTLCEQIAQVLGW
ncbi:MAG: response regulator [Leptolyngbyaceae bacterium]|nr:response regulator [Leptolyngbyaceae bacterium]